MTVSESIDGAAGLRKGTEVLCMCRMRGNCSCCMRRLFIPHLAGNACVLGAVGKAHKRMWLLQHLFARHRHMLLWTGRFTTPCGLPEVYLELIMDAAIGWLAAVSTAMHFTSFFCMRRARSSRQPAHGGCDCTQPHAVL